MNIVKYSIIFILVLGLFQPAAAEKRRKPVPMSELTNPSSPSYVPIPYPKTREEIIIDLKYAIKATSPRKEGAYIVGRIPEFENMLLNLLEEDPVYKVGPIFKVKNRSSGVAHKYTWLILIQDRNGKNVVRVGLHANGLYFGAGSIYPHREKDLVKSDNEILDIVSESIEQPIEKKNVKRIERVAFPSTIGDKLAPLWEIVLKNGTVYYYSVRRDCVYGIEQEKQWKVKENGVRQNLGEILPYTTTDFLPDKINDKILVLKKYKRKNKAK